MSRTRERLHLVLAGLVIYGIAVSNSTTPAEIAARQSTSPCPVSPPPNARPLLLSSCLPYAPTFNPDDFNKMETAQTGFDVFSWRSFVALNWPTDPNKVIGADGDNPTVWQTFNESYQVFLKDGSAPHWGPPVDIPVACRDITQDTLGIIQMTQKVSNEVIDFAQQPFNTGPLVDQRGVYARYGIYFNKVAFDYILNNKLYNQEGQVAFTQRVDFPAGDNNTKTYGAIVLKSAWRVLDPQRDDLSRYHTNTFLVYTPAHPPDVPKETCEKRILGLVGLHFMTKTTGAPQWIWSTFEHVDNVRAGRNAPPGLKPTFYNPDCGRQCPPINKPPKRPWNSNLIVPANQRGQVTRLIPIDRPTIDLNKQWQDALAAVNPKSVWQYYELISTQWPTKARGGTPTGNPAPQFLANTTMETYLQGRVPNVSSSCIMCHNNATTTNGKFADFSYLLERARKEKK